MEQPAAKKTRSERATQEQLQCYVQFCRDHPHLQTGKNNPNNPNLIGSLWEEIAVQLNAQRGPSRTAAKWKESLSLWKYQLRSRARKLKMEQRLTGGGPCSKSLSEFEELALCTFGSSAVDGVAEIGTLGLRNPDTSGSLPRNPGADSLPPSSTSIFSPHSPGAESMPYSPGAESMPYSPSADSMPPSPGAMALPPSAAARTLTPSPGAESSKINKDELVQEILKRMKQRDERDRVRDERDKELLEVLKNISNALNRQNNK